MRCKYHIVFTQSIDEKYLETPIIEVVLGEIFHRLCKALYKVLEINELSLNALIMFICREDST